MYSFLIMFSLRSEFEKKKKKEREEIENEVGSFNRRERGGQDNLYSLDPMRPRCDVQQ